MTRIERAGSQGLAEVVEAQAALMRQVELSAALSQQRTGLVGFPQSEGAIDLLQAQDEWNTEMYEEAYSRLARLEGMNGTYRSRLALLARIESSAPSWAHAIAQRQGGHGTAQLLGDRLPRGAGGSGTRS